MSIRRVLSACVLAAMLFVPGVAGRTGPIQVGISFSAPNPTMPGPAAPGHLVKSVRMYLIALSDGGKSGPKIGCGDSLVAVTRPITPTRAPLAAAYRLLLTNHQRYYGQSGLYNPLYQARVALQRAAIKNGSATIYLTGRLNLRGVCDDPRVKAQLTHTALQFPNVHSVHIYLNGVPLRKVLSGKG